MHADNCPSRYQVRRDAERDAEYGMHRRNPYDCDESNLEYRREIYRAEARRREQRQYDDMQAEQEYYSMIDMQELDRMMEGQQPTNSDPLKDAEIPF